MESPGRRSRPVIKQLLLIALLLSYTFGSQHTNKMSSLGVAYHDLTTYSLRGRHARSYHHHHQYQQQPTTKCVEGDEGAEGEACCEGSCRTRRKRALLFPNRNESPLGATLSFLSARNLNSNIKNNNNNNGGLVIDASVVHAAPAAADTSNSILFAPAAPPTAFQAPVATDIIDPFIVASDQVSGSVVSGHVGLADSNRMLVADRLYDGLENTGLFQDHTEMFDDRDTGRSARSLSQDALRSVGGDLVRIQKEVTRSLHEQPQQQQQQQPPQQPQQQLLQQPQQQPPQQQQGHNEAKAKVEIGEASHLPTSEDEFIDNLIQKESEGLSDKKGKRWVKIYWVPRP